MGNIVSSSTAMLWRSRSAYNRIRNSRSSPDIFSSRLQAAFGVRIEESFMLRPLEAVRDPQMLAVVRGTKGGFPREVPIESKMAILEEAASLSNGVTGSTVPTER